MRLGGVAAGVDYPTAPGSDGHILATAVANVQLLGFMNVNSAESAANALDATGEDLDRIREAEGLPEVQPSKAAGKIVITVSGATTIPGGTPGTLPNGLAFVTVGTVANPADRQAIDVELVDAGSDGNLAGGSTVSFDAPPVNVASEAVVSEAFPLRGGSDGEDDARLRQRIINARRNRPAGGNWAQLRQWALEAVPSIQDAYVYPALGGPGSTKVVPVRPFDFDLNDYSRVLGDVELQSVRSFIQSKMPVPQEVVIQAAADEALDVTLKLALPASAQAGGNGQGWADPAPWPPTPTQAVTITSVNAGNDQITVDAATSTSPLAGLTHVAWWSALDRKFYSRLVVAVSGSSGAWVLTLESPLLGVTGDGPAAGDYVSPAAFRLDDYAMQWMTVVGGFGPGENTTDSGRLPRAKRNPFLTDEDPAELTNETISRWSRNFAEISNFSLLYSNLTAPTVPTSVATAPNVLVPRKFAIYEL